MSPMDGDGARAERLSTVLWVMTVAFGVAGAVLTLVVWRSLDPRDGFPNLFSGLSGILYATLGAVIVRRARNPIGWILQGIALGLALLSFAGAYSVAGLVWRPGSFPGAVAAAGFADWVFGPTLTALGFLLFLFPTGRLPSPRWRPVLVVGLIAAGVTTIGVIVNPVTYGVPAPGGVSSRIVNPGGIEALGDAVSAVLVVSILTVIAVVGAAFVSLIVRYRYAGRDERQQIKWLAFVAALALVSQAVAFASLIACGCDNSPVANVAFIGTEVAAFIGIPAAITIAILRYRLYDIDVIINRALVYGLIATALTAIYVGVVVGVGALVGSSGSSTLTIVAAVAIALLFQPLRRRAQRLANRLVYGDRATPYQVLSDFAERMAGTYALDDVLERMASILADGTGATRVDVWLRVGGELRPVAAWPADAPRPRSDRARCGRCVARVRLTRAVAVRHGAELFGALTLIKPRNEPLTPTEDKLLEDLASQAGLVLRNARLAAELQESVDELRASRRRLVEAQDEERRKIERNLHDGAQQQLVALTVQLGLLERLADDPERVRQMSAQLQAALRDALDDCATSRAASTRRCSPTRVSP